MKTIVTICNILTRKVDVVGNFGDSCFRNRQEKADITALGGSKMKLGENETIDVQCAILHRILKQNTALYQVIRNLYRLNLNDCYVGGGCVFQTVWNYQMGFEPNYGITDIDLIYFDDSDLSEDAENKAIIRVQQAFHDVPYTFDVKNEARVHLWYKRKFGIDISPYTSSESAINTWPTVVSSVGVYHDGKNFKIYAPYGLNDMFGRIVRANKLLITQDVFEKKAAKWKSKWNDITVLDW